MPSVFGRITLGGNEPATRATVELHNPVGDHISQVVVDDDGAYRFHLTPGKWRLNVYDAEGHRGKKDFDLGDEDERIDLDIGA